MSEDYRGGHQPFEDGDPLHALSSRGTFPPDVYTHPEWYVAGEGWQESAAVVLAVRGQPDALVRIFRAVPEGVEDINRGDWVCLQESYARRHAIQNDNPADDWPVIAAVVPAHTIRSGGSDLLEWGYYGPARRGTRVEVSSA